MKYLIFLILLLSLSCSAPVKRCGYDDCNDCGRMDAWEKDLLETREFIESGIVSKSSGIRKDRKVRVLILSKSADKSGSNLAAREKARRLAIFEAKRHVSELVRLEYSGSQHAADMEGIAILYRGKSYAGEKGQKMFSDTMKEILDKGQIICMQYDNENRCLILLEYDLALFDR